MIKIGMAAAHPGEIVKEFLDDLHLTIADAARWLGVRRATLSRFINGKASLSPEMALRIEQAFGPKMDVMLRIQARYDAEAQRARAATINVARYEAPDAPADPAAP